MAQIAINPKLLQEERRLATKIARALKKLSESVANSLEALDGTKGLIEDILIDLDLYFGEIADDIVLHDGRVWDLNEKIQLRNLRRLGQLGLINLEQIRAAKEVYLEATRNLILSTEGGVIPTTVNKVREIVGNGITQGESYTQIAKTIREQAQAGVFSKDRAKLIAVNQTKLAYEVAGTQPYQQLVANGVMVRKQWLTVGDDRVTPTHTQNQEDGWIHYNATFSGTGDLLPPASDNPRCRCTIQYEVNGES